MKSSELFEILKNFSETKVLSGKSLAKVKLKKAVFAGGTISDTDFGAARLAGSDFSGAGISDTKFEKAGLKKADFSGGSLLRSVFAGADLNVALFKEADIRESDFSGAVCEFCEFTGAKVYKSGFVGTNCKASNMDGAHFTEADFTKADMSDCSLKGARVERSNMAETVMMDMNASGAVFSNVGFSKSDFGFTDLIDARFSDCDLSGVSFKYTDVSRAVFERCKLDGANFKGVIGLTEEMREKVLASGGKVSKRPFKIMLDFLVVNPLKKIGGWLGSAVPAFLGSVGLRAADICGMDRKLKYKALAYCFMYVLLVVLILSAIKAFLAISCIASGRCAVPGMMMSRGPGAPITEGDMPGRDEGDPGRDINGQETGMTESLLGPVDASGQIIDLEHAPVIPVEGEHLVLPEGCGVSTLASWDKSRCMQADEETIKFSYDRTFVGNWGLGVLDQKTLNFMRYETGLCVTPGKKIRYFLNGRFRQFYAVATIPPEVSRNVKATFLVYLDGKLAYESKVLPHPMTEVITVDVSGAQCMELETKFAYGSDDTDYLIWGNLLCASQPEGFKNPEPAPADARNDLVPLKTDSACLKDETQKFATLASARLLDKLYTNALTLASGKSAVITLEPGAFSTFEAVVGFDTSVFPPEKMGEAKVRIVADDGRVLFSDYIIFGDAKQVSVDLAGVSGLTVATEVVKGSPADIVFANAGFKAPAPAAAAPESAVAADVL